MSDLQALLGRVEAASGPDRELDEAIALPFGWREVSVDYGIRIVREWVRPEDFRLPIGTMANPPFFTASLDAALALAERVLPGWTWSVGSLAIGGHAYLMQKQGAALIGGKAASPSLALLAALLRALIAKGETHEP